MQTIEHALINGGSLKTVKMKLGLGKNEIYGLREEEDNFITNMGGIVEDAEEFCTDLYSIRNNPDGNDGGREADKLVIPPVSKEEIRKALAAMQRGKVPGEDQVSADPLKDGGEIALEKLAALYTQCLKTSTVP